jgi:transcriptional regulator NrdR family protein
MKCPRCGAWALIKETRAKEDNTMRRRYECGNLHRFTTIEYVRPESIVTRTVPTKQTKD